LPAKEEGKVTLLLHPFEDLRVRILKPDGSPANGMKLWVAGVSDGSGARFQDFGHPPLLDGNFWRATTDREGHCVIPALPAGFHVYLNHGDPAYAQFEGRHQVMVSHLRAGEAEQTFTLVPPGSVRGRVVTPDGKSIAGVGVTIIERDPYKTAYSDTAFSDAQGHFHFQQVPPSIYRLQQHFQPPARDEWVAAERENIAVKSGELELGELKAAKVAIVTAQVVNKDTDEELESPLVFYLPPGKHEIRYRAERMVPKGYERDSPTYDVPVEVREGDRLTVYFKLIPYKPEDMVSGTVLGLDGKPLANAKVMVVDLWGHPFAVPQATDAAGQFSVPAAKDRGAHVLIAWGADHEMSEMLSVKRGETVTVPLKKEGFSSVGGWVTDDDGKPVHRAVVRLSRDGIDIMTGPFSDAAKTDGEGRFLFPQVWNNQTYHLNVRASGYGSAYKRDIKIGNAQHEDALEFKIARADASLSGIVLDAAGKPVANAWVNGSGKGQPAQLNLKTDLNGRFRLEKLVKGKLTLSVGIVTGDYTVEKKVQITVADHNEELRISLPPPATGEMTGVVVDERGHALPGVKIWPSGTESVTDDQGRFHLKGLAPGWINVDFTAVDQERGQRRKRFRLKAGMKDLRIVVPDKEPPVDEYSEMPVNMIGKMAPPIETAHWFNSETLAATPFGKVRITDFWNTGCAPCVATMPKIQKFWEQHREENLEIISLHAPGPELEVQEFIEKHHYTFPMAVSAEGSKAYRAFDIRYNPVYVVTDTTGKIVSYGSDWEKASKVALELLGK